ncbi:MAG: CcoQ/FixQ family Cbb3-type cytochrome c oxidase assembly chaperone [Flavipsychrobacter sp.]|jgi:hypothetical protein|nr:CcoQ/FixQ family Cbb3-type cytochrome c oxidase assembly chaperone [Flavipsychrobacter sp.]
MKFKHYLETITGVSIYPLVSLTIFFVFFSIVAIWALKADKKYISSMKSIPFPENDSE